jgi:hypothetical protein
MSSGGRLSSAIVDDVAYILGGNRQWFSALNLSSTSWYDLSIHNAATEITKHRNYLHSAIWLMRESSSTRKRTWWDSAQGSSYLMVVGKEGRKEAGTFLFWTLVSPLSHHPHLISQICDSISDPHLVEKIDEPGIHKAGSRSNLRDAHEHEEAQTSVMPEVEAVGESGESGAEKVRRLEREVKDAQELAQREAKARRDLEAEVKVARELIQKEVKARHDQEANIKTLQNRLHELESSPEKLHRVPPAAGTSTELTPITLPRVSLAMMPHPLVLIISYSIPLQSDPWFPAERSN